MDKDNSAQQSKPQATTQQGSDAPATPASGASPASPASGAAKENEINLSAPASTPQQAPAGAGTTQPPAGAKEAGLPDEPVKGGPPPGDAKEAGLPDEPVKGGPPPGDAKEAGLPDEPVKGGVQAEDDEDDGKDKATKRKSAVRSAPAKKGKAVKKGAAGARPKDAKAKSDKKPKEEVPPLTKMVIKNEFYRDGYRSILKLAVLQAIVIIGLIGAMFFVIHAHQPENKYFATTEDGRLVPLVPLNDPNLSTPALMSWTAQAATETMTFGFNDYKRRMQESSRYFTRKGWESFTRALQASRILELVEENQQVVSAAPKGAPVLKSEGEVQGLYQWIIQQPLVVTYTAGSKTRHDSLMVTLVVVRVPRLESPNGIGIEQWISGPGG
jgi:intracellular multiplication protein IcmL